MARESARRRRIVRVHASPRGRGARWVLESRPFFGSCWGHHFLAGPGVTVAGSDPERESGPSPVDLPAGAATRSSPRCRSGSRPRWGTTTVSPSLPEGAEALAHSERCPNQCIKLDRQAGLFDPVPQRAWPQADSRETVDVCRVLYGGQESCRDGATREALAGRTAAGGPFSGSLHLVPPSDRVEAAAILEPSTLEDVACAG